MGGKTRPPEVLTIFELPLPRGRVFSLISDKEAEVISLEIEGYRFPDELYYSDQFIWVREEDDDLVTIGLNELATKAVKEFAVIEIFFPVGYELTAGQPMGASDSWKGTLSLYAPISGKITAVNEEVELDPLLLMDNPYENWFVKVAPTNFIAEKEALMEGGSTELVRWVKATMKKIL